MTVEIEKTVKKMQEVRDKVINHIHKYGLEANGALDAHDCLYELEPIVLNLSNENERLKAELEAQKAVSERFKKLYVDEVVNKALEESANDQAEV